MGTRTPLTSLPEVARNAVESYFDPVQALASLLAEKITKSSDVVGPQVQSSESLPPSAVVPESSADAADDRRTRRLARLSIAEAEAQRIVETWSSAAGAVGWVPGCMFSLQTLSPDLIRAVAKVFGVENYALDAARESIAAMVPKAFMASEVLSFLPVVGWVAKGAFSAMAVKSMGDELIRYFRARSPYRMDSSGSSPAET